MKSKDELYRAINATEYRIEALQEELLTLHDQLEEEDEMKSIYEKEIIRLNTKIRELEASEDEGYLDVVHLDEEEEEYDYSLLDNLPGCPGEDGTYDEEGNQASWGGMSFMELEFYDFLEVLEMGAKKYGRDGWLEADGATCSHKDMHASMSRHLAESSVGEISDNESGLHPQLHVAARALMDYTRWKRNIVHKDDYLPGYGPEDK